MMENKNEGIIVEGWCNQCNLPLPICECKVLEKKKALEKTQKLTKTKTGKINFLDEQVIYDVFFNSKKSFVEWYVVTFNLSSLECQIIYDGIRDNVTRYSPNFFVFSSLTEDERLELRERLLGIKQKIVKDIDDKNLENLLLEYKNKPKKDLIKVCKEKFGMGREELLKIVKCTEGYLDSVLETL